MRSMLILKGNRYSMRLCSVIRRILNEEIEMKPIMLLSGLRELDNASQPWLDTRAGKRILAAGFFAAALYLRVQNLHASPYGDEAYYYFVTRHLDAWWDTQQYPVSGSVFPLFPLFFHWFSQSLTRLRVANAVVGAIAAPVVLAILARLQVRSWIRVIAALMVAIDPILVQFSSLAFLDMFGAVIALLALWAYVAERYVWAATLTALAVLEKEYFVFLGFAMAVDYLVRYRRLYGSMVLAGLVVIGWVWLRYGVFHASAVYLIQDHAHNPLTWSAMEPAIITALLLPWIIYGFIHPGPLRVAGYFLLMEFLFLRFWGNAQDWYWCLPIMMSILLSALGMDQALTWWRTHTSWPALGVVMALFLVLTVGWTSVSITRNTASYIQTWHAHHLVSVAQYLQRLPPAGLDLIDCFWGYQYYPLGSFAHPAQLVSSWSQVRTPRVVVGNLFIHAPANWTLVFSSGDYRVYQSRSVQGSVAAH